jgi:hypothetical protein
MAGFSFLLQPMPRTRDTDTRDHFSAPYVEIGASYKRVDCIHCKESVSDTVARMKGHLEGCSKYSPTIELDAEAQEKIRKRKLEMGSVIPFADKMSEAEKTKADYLLAKALHRNGLAFSLFDDPLWTEFFYCLRPAYRLPCVEKISNKLLNDQYMEVQSEADKILQENALFGLQFSIDGLTDIKRKQTSKIFAGQESLKKCCQIST